MDANVTIQIQNKHKEEISTRILDDSKDRFSSRKKCTTSNIISLHDKNLDRAIEIGITFMYIFEANWSDGFRDSITKQIAIISWVGKPLKVGTEMVYDPAVIHGRVLELQLSPKSININNIYWYTNWLHSQLLCLTLQLKRR